MVKRMKIYFAGSICGGREKVYDYKEIINVLKEYGDVLTEHLGNENISNTGEVMNPTDIYTRDINWLTESNLVVADITIPSLGVGYELAYAEKLNKKIIVCYENKENISAMIRGNNNFIQIPYDNISDLLTKIDEVMENLNI